ncbi:dihydrodipicolinate synthase family protein [Paractinoplanes atraurantiacus]|uniref:4-hydroxy-tetrahydrodipicolinate synthase n=1 Tax=Paractinoplanes atraurantiacus TaxID=1036182 RepID=A0A285IC05_9ACTN|nr:dihydrodipicolinate synthase family protein [Actinoplanes atraurantiacus]SNY45317.1 4-hydroxy-tetrahydrodipicolinate synthase [Actinoplanes atraurantiacus]
MLTGLYVPLITPFDASGDIAVGALTRLAHDVLDGGAAGLVALGTTGEPSALTPAERATVLKTLTATGAPLIVGANDAATLAGLDATAALTLVPPFVRPGEDGVVAHLSALAQASPVPLVVYHVPYRTAQPLTVEALHRIAAIPNVIGVKLAAGGIDADTVALLADPPEDFAVLGGDDAYISPLLAMGAHGGILASAHIDTGSYADLIAAWQSGDTARARPLGHRLARLSAALFAEPNPTVVKGVLHAQGRIPTPHVRLPLLPAAAASVDAALSRTLTDSRA